MTGLQTGGDARLTVESPEEYKGPKGLLRVTYGENGTMNVLDTVNRHRFTFDRKLACISVIHEDIPRYSGALPSLDDGQKLLAYLTSPIRNVPLPKP